MKWFILPLNLFILRYVPLVLLIKQIIKIITGFSKCYRNFTYPEQCFQLKAMAEQYRLFLQLQDLVLWYMLFILQWAIKFILW